MKRAGVDKPLTMESGPKVSCVLLASVAFLMFSANSFGETHDSTDARSGQDCSKAFADPEFEDRATLGKVQDGVERLPGCGLNGSGGIRLHVAPGAKNVSYRFPSDFRPKAGRKYVFSICRKVHGNARVELYWQCWGKDGWCRKQNWNTTLVPLDGKPFMPLGFYTSLGSSGGDLDHARRELKKISDAGFNTIMEYWITSFQGKDKIAKFYSACRANNIKVLFNFSGAYKTPDKMDEHVAMAKRQLDAGAPILAWYTLDEAPFSLLPPIRSLRHTLNRFSPGIPTWQVNIREIEPYLDVADVLGGDHYLIGRRQGVLKQMNQYMALAA